LGGSLFLNRGIEAGKRPQASYCPASILLEWAQLQLSINSDLAIV
jgi:hypothetical protein